MISLPTAPWTPTAPHTWHDAPGCGQVCLAHWEEVQAACTWRGSLWQLFQQRHAPVNHWGLAQALLAQSPWLAWGSTREWLAVAKICEALRAGEEWPASPLLQPNPNGGWRLTLGGDGLLEAMVLGQVSMVQGWLVCGASMERECQRLPPITAQAEGTPDGAEAAQQEQESQPQGEPWTVWTWVNSIWHEYGLELSFSAEELHEMRDTLNQTLALLMHAGFDLSRPAYSDAWLARPETAKLPFRHETREACLAREHPDRWQALCQQVLLERTLFQEQELAKSVANALPASPKRNRL